MIDPLLLTTARVSTFNGTQGLTNATGFFFERGKRLFLVSSRHVFIDEAAGHRPDRIEIEIHDDPENLAQSMQFSIPLYRDGKSLWRQGIDSAGQIDVALIEIERKALPKQAAYRAFTPKHLVDSGLHVDIGADLVVVGFPLGFHDTLHHLPVARQAGLASSFGLRFQGAGYFLTDARTHRGVSGAPVV
ncbi:MAG TPA: trypsin-like peptidase domain-containing protein, partial [Methylovirgula sp.]